ncbi:hypothetical protein [Magnetospirillum molischianum]|uniref:Uncharacterized protein n=1 Tax=Magnetospirillum molischianum DSM 120 TaxID=1150626 RepID=H8FXE1_MAGML|nr:hypothetical protein [Magnetospirillum molischianum]CCG43029.1 exported hypothetical protein [Magnetospirillum molischianum DSM 120]
MKNESLWLLALLVVILLFASLEVQQSNSTNTPQALGTSSK